MRPCRSATLPADPVPYLERLIERAEVLADQARRWPGEAEALHVAEPRRLPAALLALYGHHASMIELLRRTVVDLGRAGTLYAVRPDAGQGEAGLRLQEAASRCERSADRISGL